MTNEVDALAELGFPALEANIYLFLLRNSPATGYHVAHCLHKPVTNTYKALESLCRKGCLVVDQAAKPRRYSALPLSEYLDGLERSFRKKRAAAETLLKSVAGSMNYPGIYRLENLDQVYAAAVRLIGTARVSILVDAFPKPMAKVRGALEKAIRRKVRVLAKAYAPLSLRGVDVTLSDLGPEIADWPGELLFVVVDGNEYLMAFVKDSAGAVLEAVWSQNLYLAIIAYNSLLSEMLYSRIAEKIADDPAYSGLRRILEKYQPFHTHNTPAFETFVGQYGPQGTPK
jgi:HTH-type transcriptional regulator, sugar sensing transcriptional regulator